MCILSIRSHDAIDLFMRTGFILSSSVNMFSVAYSSVIQM